MSPVGGPEWRESWAIHYLDPIDPDAVAFLVECARERLAKHAREKTPPLLSDILISRLAATLATRGETGERE